MPTLRPMIAADIGGLLCLPAVAGRGSVARGPLDVAGTWRRGTASSGDDFGARPESGLDLHEHAGGNDEAVQGLDGAVVRFGDVDDPLVGADLELLA